MPGVRLVIFDCDGVLVDSEVISNTVLARMLTEEGLALTLSQARARYQGMLLEDVVRAAERALGRPLQPRFIERYEQQRSDAFRSDLKPVAGAHAAVEAVIGAGLDVCVASQGSLAKTELSLELTGLAAPFPPRARFSAETVARGKPFPDLFLHAAEAMGAKSSECVLVEDTPSGVSAARAAGMRVFGLSADADEQALRAAGAEIIDTLDELPPLLGLERA